MHGVAVWLPVDSTQFPVFVLVAEVWALCTAHVCHGASVHANIAAVTGV